MQIPKIIHQVWEGRTEEKMPIRLRILAESWKEKNPDWEYHLWNGEEMDRLVEEEFPDFMELYHSFSYNVQRWDTIRYMILHVYGGLYVDLDTECFKSLNPLFLNKTCCFGEEPPEHIQGRENIQLFIGNAFMYSLPGQEAWLQVLKEIRIAMHKGYPVETVVNTTGPLMLSRIQEKLIAQHQVEIIPYEQVTPVTKMDMIDYAKGTEIEAFHQKIKRAYCAHYFFGSWEKSFSIY